eukprot:3554394-Alexandrium_andersonii.AAC.1
MQSRALLAQSSISPPASAAGPSILRMATAGTPSPSKGKAKDKDTPKADAAYDPWDTSYQNIQEGGGEGSSCAGCAWGAWA